MKPLVAVRELITVFGRRATAIFSR
jgi:hypothetical protein